MVLEANIKENGLIISDIWSMDIENLEIFSPPEEGFVIGIDLSIGPENGKGTDDFRFTLVDKKGLIKILEHDQSYIRAGITSINNYNLVVMDNYSYPKLEIALREILKSIDRSDNWSYIASQLNKYFYWEYEREFRSKLKK
jgi:hypothetical protein